MTRLEITVALVAARYGPMYGVMFEHEKQAIIKEAEELADMILASFVAHEEGREWPPLKPLLRDSRLMPLGETFVGERRRSPDDSTWVCHSASESDSSWLKEETPKPWACNCDPLMKIAPNGACGICARTFGHK